MYQCVITRDSVCMADDVDAPHQIIEHLAVCNASFDCIDQLWRLAQLPLMGSWSCHINGESMAHLWFDDNTHYRSLRILYSTTIHLKDYKQVHFSYVSYDSRQRQSSRESILTPTAYRDICL